MGTRSTIAILHKDGSVKSIYAHWEGYISNNGRLLYQHYRDINKVKELIGLGKISILRPEIHPPNGVEHSFDNPDKKTTVFYGRDRGEDDTNASEFPSLEDYIKNGDFQEYDYVFDEKKNEWYFLHNTKKLQKLTTLLKKDKEVSSDVKKMIESEKQAKKLEKELATKQKTSKDDLARYKL